MTATKANWAAAAGNVIVLANWLLTLIPGWELFPDEPKAATIALVSGGIGWLFVYYAPSNVSTSSAPTPAPTTERIFDA